jgi:PAS domain S-box-containing protein
MEKKMTKKEMLKEKPLGELKALRQRIAELEAIVAAYNSDEKSNEFDDVQKYRAVFESTTDVVLVIDKKGKITDVNKRLKEISGYEQEALIGKNITALAGMMTEKSFAQVSSNFLKRVFGVNMPPYEVEMIKKNRASIIVEISAQPLKKNDKIIGDLVILRDVTERKQVEESLKASEEKYSTIIEQSTDGIIILNNRLVEFANHKMCEMSGYSQIEILGRNFHELVAPEYEELLIEKQQEGLSKQIVSEHDEMELITKGGKKIPVESKLISIVYKGNPAGMAIIRDITEEKIAEEALKKSEESFRNTLDNSPMGIRISDKQDDTLYVNQAFLNMFDYENTEELRASPPLKHYTPESYADFLLRMEKQRGGKPRPDSVEIDIVRKDGTIRNLWLSTRELIWYGKQQFQNLYIDITNKKTAEEAVKESETRYHELVNTISSGVFIYKAVDNGADFVFVDINSAVEKMEGINRKDIIGKRVTEVLPNVKDYYWFSVFQRVWQTGNSEYFASGERQDERETGRWRDNWAHKLPNGEIMNIYDDITERKRAELALKASEENFRNSMDDTLLGVRISDIDNRTLYANQALLDIFGYKNIDEVRAKSPQAYYSPESYADYLMMKEKLSRGETMPTQA